MSPRATSGRHAWALAALATLALAGGCGRPRPVDRHLLHQGLRLAERVALVVPEGPAGETARRAAARPPPAGLAGWPRLEWVAPAAAERSWAAAGPRILVGTWDTPGLAPVLERLGVVRAEGGFAFEHAGGAGAVGTFDLLEATCADPRRRGLPVSILLARDLDEALPWLERAAPAARPFFRAWRGGDLVAEGELAPSGEGLPARLHRFEPESLAQGSLVRRAPGLVVRCEPTGAPAGTLGESQRRARLEAYASALERARDRLLAAAGRGPAELPELEVRVFEQAADLARTTGRWELSVRNARTGAVAALVDGAEPALDDGGAAYAGSLARALLGPPTAAWIEEGLAVHAADRWWGRPLESWVARLAAGGLVPADPDEVLGDDPPHSPHVVAPLRAAFLRRWLAQRPGELPALWGGTAALDAQADWPAFSAQLEELAGRLAPERAAERAARRAGLSARGFLGGVNLCAPTPDGAGGSGAASAAARERGFGSSACEQSLSDLRALGANAVALCVVGVADGGGPQRAFDPPAPGPTLVDSDLALVATMRAAAARGLGVMVRPFVYERPSGNWAGDHAEESEERHEAFFARYRRLLVHVALLAELGEAELVCAGSELAKTTRTDPEDDPWIPDFNNENEGRWRGLIADVRGVFSGAVTYAADGRGEAERIGFWDALDHPALDLYWPLTVPPGDPVRPSDADLRQRLRGLLRTAAELGAAHGRPCLLTEIGFPSSSRGWQFPERTLGAPDLEEQARMLQALAEAHEALQPAGAELGGIYLWNWSTDPDAGRLLDESYTPQNRPAEPWLGRLFSAAGGERDG